MNAEVVGDDESVWGEIAVVDTADATSDGESMKLEARVRIACWASCDRFRTGLRRTRQSNV